MIAGNSSAHGAGAGARAGARLSVVPASPAAEAFHEGNSGTQDDHAGRQLHGAATAEAWTFARLDDFLRHFQPLTPWGRDHADAGMVIDDASLIVGRFDDIDAVLAYRREASGAADTRQASRGDAGGQVENRSRSAARTDAGTVGRSSVALDRISYHLKRMPRLPLDVMDVYEQIELFQMKKFLANYRGLGLVVSRALSDRFGLEFLSGDPAIAALAASLDNGGPDPETFYLADCYDEGLAPARAAIRTADKVILDERIKAEAMARLHSGISFDGRDFLVLPVEKALSLAQGVPASGGERPLFSVEPFDDKRSIVRMLPSSASLAAMSDRERALLDERTAEARAMVALSALAAQAIPGLVKAVNSVARLDVAWAAAIMTETLGLTRPLISSGGMTLEAGRFVPVQEDCSRLGLRYEPLDIDLTTAATVLFGSNMGGKTVVLQTVLFMQIVTQLGLFVPAVHFSSGVYDAVVYVGELGGERLAGLSGFGLEVWRMHRAWNLTGAVLIAFDELARTTGSHEAEALLSAVVEAWSVRTGCLSVFATHFRGVARLQGVAYRKMRGLDRREAGLETADTHTAGAFDAPAGDLATRLAGINRHMRYHVDADDGTDSSSDALAIAAFLGLDGRIVGRAGHFLAALKREEGDRIQAGHI